VALIYADFGSQAAEEIATVKLESCAEYAGMAIESTLLQTQQAAKHA
jgi:hypothetical protein